MTRPLALCPGDTIGVCAPASPVNREEVEAGIAAIEARGYRVARGEHLFSTRNGDGYLAGEDEERLSDLKGFTIDNSISAIFCAGGGYGSMRLFESLEFTDIRSNPKIFLGFSDITSLHLVLVQSSSQITFHGKMVQGLDRLDIISSDCLWKQLESDEPFGMLPADPSKIKTIVPGIVEGELLGGCLCLLAHACGSKYQPDFRGKIVLLEDVGESIYRVDRYLTQLLNAGTLQEAAGFVLGTITDWHKHEAVPPKSSLDQLWNRFFEPLGKPTLSGFPFGHVPNPLTLPLGVRACLDASSRSLCLLDSSVRRL